MFLIQLLNMLKGYVEIEVCGLFLERFLNICTRRGIYLWNVKRLGRSKMRANISINGFKLLIPVAKKSRCTAHITCRKGLPFFLHRHRKRKAFAVGVLVFAILLYYMTTFVWVIDVTGNKRVETEKILTCLEQNGIKAGVGKNQIDAVLAQSLVMTAIPEVAWVSINVKGTTVMVDVKERTVLPEKFEKDKPCNIVATDDGVVEEMVITSGKSLVKINDVVKKGQILVSGAMDSERVGMRFVHSDGKVMARTWHEETAQLPMYEEIKTQTGKNKSKHALKIFDFYVKLYVSDKIAFPDYERVSYVKNLSLGNNNVLPISFHYDNYYELEVTKKKLSNKQAIEKFTKELDEKYKDIQVVKRDVKVEGDHLKATYECIEDITQKTELVYEEVQYDDNGEDVGS